MKKLLWLLLLMLSAVLFFACGEDNTFTDAVGESDGFLSTAQDVFPDAPPQLTVSVGEQQITAWRGTYSWETRNVFGIGRAVHADSMHPLDAGDAVPALTVSSGGTVLLDFSAAPDSIKIRYYPVGAESYDAHEIYYLNSVSLELAVNDGLYEIIAAWDGKTENYSGDAYYAFRAEIQ